jgi:hypothetical protein
LKNENTSIHFYIKRNLRNYFLKNVG